MNGNILVGVRIDLQTTDSPLGTILLIREVVRRRNRGWLSIILFGLAYAIFEEGFLTQSLFNPDYMQMHLHLLSPAYISPLRMGGWWTLWMLNVHAVWSIATPIALVESCWVKGAKAPWLSPFGLGLVSVLFAAGCIMTASFTSSKDHFTALPIQFIGAGAACALLILSAMVFPRKRSTLKTRPVPKEWICGLFALALGSVALCAPSSWGWGAVAVLWICDLVAFGAVITFTRYPEWSAGQKLALAAGAALAYGWHAFLQIPAFGSGPAVRVGNGVFLSVTLGIILIASKRVHANSQNPKVS